MMGLLVLTATATAAPCPGATTPEVEACLKIKLDQSQADLNRYVAATIDRIEKEDTPQTRKAFKIAQDA